MAALTAQQRNMLRLRVGDSGGVFTDTILDTVWDTVSSAVSTTQQIEASLYLMWEMVAAGAVKLHDYKAGQSEEKLSQVFTNAEKMMKKFQSAYDAAVSQRQQVVIAAVRPVENQNREYPSEHCPPTRRRSYPQ